MCLIAFSKDISCFVNIPDNYKTQQISFDAVNYNGDFLKYVPEKFINEELCMLALKTADLNALNYFPEKIINNKLCLETIKKNGMNLMYVPEKFINYELCLEAVKNNGKALEYLPKKFI